MKSCNILIPTALSLNFGLLDNYKQTQRNMSTMSEKAKNAEVFWYICTIWPSMRSLSTVTELEVNTRNNKNRMNVQFLQFSHSNMREHAVRRNMSAEAIVYTT